MLVGEAASASADRSLRGPSVVSARPGMGLRCRTATSEVPALKKLHERRPSDASHTLCGRSITGRVAVVAMDGQVTCNVCTRLLKRVPAVAATLESLGGIELRRGAVVLFGSEHNCTRPAVVAIEHAREHTPEWRTVVAENVRRDSARWQLLRTQMLDRLREAAGNVARAQGKDCVVGEGDILDARNLPVADLTNAVIAQLRDRPVI